MAVETPQTPAGSGRLRWLDALVLLYGIFLIAMGVVGYVKAGSKISLFAGSACGILEIGFAALTVTNPRVGRIGSAIIAVLMLGQFVPDYFLKGHKTAALLIWVFSLVVFCCLLGGHFYAMSKRKANQAA